VTDRGSSCKTLEKELIRWLNIFAPISYGESTRLDEVALPMETSSNPFPVQPTGFLVGSYLALILYGIHLTQLHSYLTRYAYDTFRSRLLVLWVFTLSTFQVIIIIVAGWKYFVGGLSDGGKIWGEFWDPLSVQDGL
jgi:hypothetical protein